ncbi:MAG TPA: hypothetical protein VF756_06320 [Thermoanaerobaculia bacterium]
MAGHVKARRLNRVSADEFRRSRAGVLGCFPSPDIYELEEVCAVVTPKEKEGEACEDKKSSRRSVSIGMEQAI